MDLRLIYFLVVLGLAKPNLIKLRCNGIKKFVNGHNWRRMWLVNGQISGQPTASRMTYMVWNEELAQKAANWAARNEYGHNPDRTIPSRKFKVGENIYQYSTTDSNYHFDTEKAMTAWFDEYKDFRYKNMEWSDFEKNYDVGHYTQMAWADSEYLGCAVSRYKRNGYHNYFVVCYYGPAGNVIGNVPYKSQQGIGSLSCGASNCGNRKPFGEACPNDRV